MTEQGGGADAKKRGVGYPQMPLRDAVEAIVTIGQHGASHSHDAAAAYLGHATANSGAFRAKLAALRDWGLLARGDRNRVILSDLAQQFVLAAPDHTTERQLLLTAFESCRVFGMLYHDSAKGTPLESQRLRNAVVMRHGVASDQADKFVDSFVSSVVYAGLGRWDGSKLTLLPRETAVAVDEVNDPEPELEATTMTATPNLVGGANSVRVAPVVTDSAIPVALRQAWPIDDGEIEFVIRTPKAMPPSLYALMAKMAEVAAAMQELLQPEQVSTSSMTANAHLVGRSPQVVGDPSDG